MRDSVSKTRWITPEEQHLRSAFNLHMHTYTHARTPTQTRAHTYTHRETPILKTHNDGKTSNSLQLLNCSHIKKRNKKPKTLCGIILFFRESHFPAFVISGWIFSKLKSNRDSLTIPVFIKGHWSNRSFPMRKLISSQRLSIPTDGLDNLHIAPSLTCLILSCAHVCCSRAATACFQSSPHELRSTQK